MATMEVIFSCIASPQLSQTSVKLSLANFDFFSSYPPPLSFCSYRHLVMMVDTVIGSHLPLSASDGALSALPLAPVASSHDSTVGTIVMATAEQSEQRGWQIPLRCVRWFMLLHIRTRVQAKRGVRQKDANGVFGLSYT